MAKDFDRLFVDNEPKRAVWSPKVVVAQLFGAHHAGRQLQQVASHLASFFTHQGDAIMVAGSRRYVRVGQLITLLCAMTGRCYFTIHYLITTTKVSGS